MNPAKKCKKSILLLAIAATLLLFAFPVMPAPDGVTITVLGNTTKSPLSGTIGNYTGNETSNPNKAGGFIFTMNITSSNQNTRWKAYIGNVSGKLTLDDQNGATIYDWTLSTVAGEVYATRSSSTINWTGIGCARLNVTEHENRIMNHSNAEDNITFTFRNNATKAMTVGTLTIPEASCNSTNIYVNSTASGNADDTFEEVILIDANGTAFNDSNSSTANVIYAQKLETNSIGFDNSSTYDFQLIVPESGATGYVGSTAYYFYVELT